MWTMVFTYDNQFAHICLFQWVHGMGHRLQCFDNQLYMFFHESLIHDHMFSNKMTNCSSSRIAELNNNCEENQSVVNQ